MKHLLKLTSLVITKDKIFDWSKQAQTGQTQTTNPLRGRVKNLIDRFTITFETEGE